MFAFKKLKHLLYEMSCNFATHHPNMANKFCELQSMQTSIGSPLGLTWGVHIPPGKWVWVVCWRRFSRNIPELSLVLLLEIFRALALTLPILLPCRTS